MNPLPQSMAVNANANATKGRIVVAMSGGVDSSVVAGLLKSQGYDVVGLTLQLYDMGAVAAKKGACCAGQDIYDAKRVAETLGIPHYVMNFESRFKEAVVDRFADSYVRGETPVPCIECNRTVKFHDLLKIAKDLGAERLATGHYVRRIDGLNGAEMHTGMDITKDQSYFLFATTREQLDFLWFPLGATNKVETRKIAESLSLIVADKPDSQDICFVPNGNYRDIVTKLRPDANEPGEFVHVDGTNMGTHPGILHFTVGQRKGLGISHTEPLYVVRIEPETKRVYVGPESALGLKEFKIRDANWLLPEFPRDGLECEVRLRSSHTAVPAKIYKTEDSKHSVVLKEPHKAVTPGQACVAYHGSRVLGGGWIIRS